MCNVCRTRICVRAFIFFFGHCVCAFQNISNYPTQDSSIKSTPLFKAQIPLQISHLRPQKLKLVPTYQKVLQVPRPKKLQVQMTKSEAEMPANL